MNNKKIHFLVIHDYDIPSKINLKNLSENRFDICLRCILAACAKLYHKEVPEINFVFYSGNLENRMKYISWNKEISLEKDEVSIASEIQDSMSSFVREDYIENIIHKKDYDLIILLEEKGDQFENNLSKIVNSSNLLLVLGAKNDVPKFILDLISPDINLSLSSESMLASHVITLIRQIMLINGF